MKIESNSKSLIRDEWERFATWSNLAISTLGGAFMTALVAWENRNNNFEDYDTALVSRFLYTLLATHVVLRVHEVVGNLLPEEMRLRKLSQIGITTTISGVCTAVAQTLGNDPETLEAIKWTVGVTAPGLFLKDRLFSSRLPDKN